MPVPGIWKPGTGFQTGPCVNGLFNRGKPDVQTWIAVTISGDSYCVYRKKTGRTDTDCCEQPCLYGPV